MDNVISRDGTSIAFDRSGEGPAVILVGGAFQGRLDPLLGPLAVLLARHFTVVNYDRRGRGDSGDTAPYAIAREVEDLAALIAEMGGSAFVFGMSSGAVLALDSAARSVEIARLALYEPPFIVDASRRPVPDDYLARLTSLISSGRRGDAVELFMTDPVGMPMEAVVAMRGAPFWPAMEAVAHTLVYDGTIMGDTMSGHQLPAGRWSSAKAPTLVIDGTESPDFQRSAVQAIVDLLPDAHRRSLEGQSHEFEPEVLAPVLDEFFIHGR